VDGDMAYVTIVLTYVTEAVECIW